MAPPSKMPPEQWASARTAWETDPRDGYAWLVDALSLPVSAQGVRKTALKDQWAKLKPPVSMAPDKVSPARTETLTKTIAETLLDAPDDAPDAPGRPSMYRPEYATLAKNYTLLGADDAQLAEFFEVSERTVHRWKAAYPEFSEALQQGKAQADARVAHSLYQRATGCSHPDTHVSNYQGQITLTPITKHYPPDVQAATFWLKNRQPQHWKERVEVQAEIKHDPFPPKEVLDAIYEKALAEAAEREKMLIGRRERLGITFGNRDLND